MQREKGRAEMQLSYTGSQNLKKRPPGSWSVSVNPAPRGGAEGRREERMRAGRSSLAGMWWDVGRVPRALPHPGDGARQGQEWKRTPWWRRRLKSTESLVAVLVEQGRRNFSGGKKDVQIERKREAPPELTVCAALGTGGDGQTGVTNRSLTTSRVQPQGLCT